MTDTRRLRRNQPPQSALDAVQAMEDVKGLDHEIVVEAGRTYYFGQLPGSALSVLAVRRNDRDTESGEGGAEDAMWLFLCSPISAQIMDRGIRLSPSMSTQFLQLGSMLPGGAAPAPMHGVFPSVWAVPGWVLEGVGMMQATLRRSEEDEVQQHVNL
ncbi:MAG: hypothetical protein AAFR42_08835 [Cyanobacteria bacterium J06628_6]